MENYYPRPNYARNKLIIIISSILLLVLSTALNAILLEKGKTVITYLLIFGFNLLIFAWCHYDALEREAPLGAGWRLLIVILGFLALLIYLLKARGFKKGLISIGITLLIWVASFIGSIITAILVLIIKKLIHG